MFIKILVAPDSFKGSLNASELISILSKELINSNLPLRVISVPLADGGEGSLDAIAHSGKFLSIKEKVFDPLYREIETYYLIDEQNNTAYVELARASGFHLVNQKPDIMHSTTFGTGQLIKHAIESGAKKIVLFIGGSATTDAGLGILEALGYKFYDSEGQIVQPLPINILKISKIDDKESILKTCNAEILIAADVTNPFYGENGAAFVYSPQKGADRKQVISLDHTLKHFAQLVKSKYNIDLQSTKGAGAAGGVGGGLVALTGAKIVSGSELIFSLLDIENKIRECDIVISGEGKIDSQSLNNKLLFNISKLVKKYKKQLWAVCGFFDGDKVLKEKLNISELFCLANEPEDIREAISNTKQRLVEVSKQIINKFDN